MKKEYIILLAIFIITLAVRLFLSFQTQDFTTDSYYHLRQIDSIKETGLPIINDELSYGGRTQIIMPIFHYTIAPLALLTSSETAAKIMQNIYLSLLVIIIYFIAFAITKNQTASLFTAAVSAFIPVMFSKINQLTPNSLLIPLIFYYIYLILKPETKQITLIILTFILPLISPAAIILSIALAVYLIISKLEKVNIEKKEMEITLFTTFTFLWIIFLLYKKALLVNGALVIWQNIPQTILGDYFTQVNILKTITMIGLVPLIIGIYVIYKQMLTKSKPITMLTSIAIVATLLLITKMIELDTGLKLLGLSLAIMFSSFYLILTEYFDKTKIPRIKWIIITALIIILILTNILPSIAFAQEKNTITKEEIKALQWIKQNTPENSTIAAKLELGQAINYIAERKNIADTNFLLINTPEQTVQDIKTIMEARYQTSALETLEKYNAKYILTNETLFYAEPNCFPLVYDDAVKIYESKCKLELK